MDMSSRRRITGLLAGHLAALGTFAVLAGVAWGLPAWLLLRYEGTQWIILCLAYLATAMLPLAFTWKRISCPALLVVFLAGCFFAGAWYGAMFVDIEIPLGHLVPLGILAIGLNLLLLRVNQPERGELLRLAVFALAFVFVSGALLGVSPLRHSAPALALYRHLEQPVSRVVNTALHNVQVNIFRARIPPSSSKGGGLAVTGDDLLLLTGDGKFYLLNLSADSEQLEVQTLDRQAPINRGEFLESPLGPENIEDFRALAVFLPHASSAADSQQQILVSHHYWYPEKSCYVVRVSSVHMPWQEFLTGNEPSGWKTLYETSPCLPLKVGTDEFFAGNQSGGQMIQTGPGTILLTVGDHGFDGVFGHPVAAQDPDYSYGKIIEIDINSGANQVFTLGHRNPQGLFQDRQGRVWETEHGPKGGDELNLINEGNNYGWPMATLGAKYFHFSWPGLKSPEPGTELVPPLFAWTPSIAVTALTQIEGGEFSRWQGDLMAASLMARSLHRIHLVDGRPMMAEPIPTRERLRDIVRDDSGRLVLWTDRGDVGVLKRAPETAEDPE